MNEDTFEPLPHFDELVELFGRFTDLLLQCASDDLRPTAAAAE